MTAPLEYIDYHPVTGQPEDAGFERICPRSSGIVKHQSGLLDYPGLTAVALIEKNNFLDHLNELQSIKSAFTRVNMLHCTLLGLLEGNEKSNANSVFIEVIYNKVKKYIDHHNLGTIQLKFDCIRPGAWRHGKNKNLVSNCSDGTVIAIGSMAAADNKKFSDIGSALAKYLRYELDYIFDPDFTRKFSTTWCTLGYFDCADFEILQDLIGLFNSKKELDIVIPIKQIELFEFYSRSLEEGNRYKSPLNL